MGLAPLIVICKALAIWRGDERYNNAARFWARIFAVNFLFGVITGIPMEFQFGTNWARFARYSGGVIATSLAMRECSLFFWSRPSWECSCTGSNVSAKSFTCWHR
jgi:cytochrome d ubiquinol oxidase subunit I